MSTYDDNNIFAKDGTSDDRSLDVGADIDHDSARCIHLERSKGDAGTCYDMDVDRKMAIARPNHEGATNEVSVQEQIGQCGPCDGFGQVDSHDSDDLVVFDSGQPD